MFAVGIFRELSVPKEPTKYLTIGEKYDKADNWYNKTSLEKVARNVLTITNYLLQGWEGMLNSGGLFKNIYPYGCT